ncbi:hypothetical protein CRI93_01845 [Longimonas halophila]|uniref:Glycosyltransferase 2-like domain-containing protein n=1 Tax=Longimonas halophila TaxID=1469170 RepID=A0A2H3NTE2_9BACT|nr:glycosyltransferase [Longimonas halophila]PEN09496.1 hypothetical protein CRI93_01845 [Longimonas halophila]
MKSATANVSIIICTRNRATDLRDTLRSLANVYIPIGWIVECIIVDNASTDATPQVIAAFKTSQFDVHTVKEEHLGKAYAANTALSQARGEILLFTDDDVRVPADWIVGMTEPIRSGRADAVAGGVALAPHLERSWQQGNPWMTALLASTSALSDASPRRLVGANMAIARRVFDTVSGFDVNLGPGSVLGLGEETLLTQQIKHAGFRVRSAFDVAVEHHCSADRLSRRSYLQAVERVGRSQGYIDYHWNCVSVSPIRLVSGLVSRYFKLGLRRALERPDLQDEGLPLWEVSLLMQIYHRRQLLTELGHPRKYAAKQPRGSVPARPDHHKAPAMQPCPPGQ